MVEIHTPPNERVIGSVWIGLSEDADGKNGIVAAYAPGIGGTPMVTASPIVLDYFRGQAQELANQTGKTIKIYRFIRVEVANEYKPET
jgi:hypothetical protein